MIKGKRDIIDEIIRYKNCFSNYESLIEKINTQTGNNLDGTLAEANAILYFLQNGFSAEYEPFKSDRWCKGKKLPDFLIEKQKKYAIEVKRINELQTIINEGKLQKYIDEKFNDIPGGFFIDIEFEKLPSIDKEDIKKLKRLHTFLKNKASKGVLKEKKQFTYEDPRSKEFKAEIEITGKMRGNNCKFLIGRKYALKCSYEKKLIKGHRGKPSELDNVNKKFKNICEICNANISGILVVYLSPNLIFADIDDIKCIA